MKCANFAQSLGDEKLYVGKENGKTCFDKANQRYYVYWFDPETLERKTTSYARWWWEVNNGEIPNKYRESYKDGNPSNINSNNIILISPDDFSKTISDRLMGHTFSEETLQKMSDAKNGITLSEEHKRKISTSLYKRWQSSEFDSIHVGENNSHWRGGIEKIYDKEYSKIRPSMSKLILSLDDEKTSLFSNQYLSLVELCDEIEKRLDELQTMDKRQKKELKQAKEDVNFLIDMYNAKAKFKTYNRVK